MVKSVSVFSSADKQQHPADNFKLEEEENTVLLLHLP
jgi:hypothetical protein